MKGIVKIPPVGLGSGIVEGADDGVDYQFYLRDFASSEAPIGLDIWSTIEFDAVDGEVPRASHCHLLEAQPLVAEDPEAPVPAEEEVPQLYELPPNILYSKNDTLPDEWEVIELSDWLVCGVSKENSEHARKQMVLNATPLKANAILSVQYFKSRTSDSTNPGAGEEVHRYEGRMAFVARKSAQGNLKRETLQSQIDAHAQAEMGAIAARHAAAARFNVILSAIFAVVALLVGVLVSYVSIVFLLLLAGAVGVVLKLWREVRIIPKVRHEPVPTENATNASI
jgi:hypothetical protein